MQREMTATGRVVKYTGPIVQADGTTKPEEIVRVGPFTAAASGAYLAYVPSLKNLQILARQPPSVFRNAEEDLQRATEGYTRAVADPGRGVLVALYGERPNVIERIRAGQEVGYVIILVGLFGFFCWV
jgi:biopolymer transport protein ExbB